MGGPKLVKKRLRLEIGDTQFHVVRAAPGQIGWRRHEEIRVEILGETRQPLHGTGPTIDLVVGHNKANRSPILELFLSRLDPMRTTQLPAPDARRR